MQNEDCRLSNQDRPASDTVRPTSRSWWVAALILGAGYGLGGLGAGLTLGYVIAAIRGGSGRWVVVLIPSAFLLVFMPFAFVNNSLGLRLRWQEKLASIANWYIVCVGLVCGWLAGIACIGILLLPWGLTRLVAIVIAFYCGPRLAFWLILRHKPQPPDPNYDDEMPRDIATTDLQLDLPDLLSTESFGRRLGSLLFPNAVIALIGPLGAGKTHLARAIAEGLGISNPPAVTSPTFTLIHEYPARLAIFHFDAYRLNSVDEFLDLGATEYSRPAASA